MKPFVAALVVLAVRAAAVPVDPLGALIGDRIASAPVDCIAAAEIDQVHLVAGVGFVFTMRSGDVVYLDRVTAGRTFIHAGVLPVINRRSTHLCSVERIRLLNENSRAPIAAATLGPFTPYRRP